MTLAGHFVILIRPRRSGWPKRGSGTARGRNTERQNLLGRSESCTGTRTGGTPTGAGLESRYLQPALRNGDRDGYHQPAPKGRLSAHSGAAARSTAKAVMDEDFSDTHDLGGQAWKAPGVCKCRRRESSCKWIFGADRITKPISPRTFW